jgi:lysophospholipase L1-like esterase
VGVGEEHWPGSYSFEACSGATTHEVTNPNGGNDGEGPQGEAVTEDTSMIFLSMGGNDAQFAPIITECLAASFANGQTRAHGGGFTPESAMIYCSDHFGDVDPDDPQGRSRMDVILDQVEDNLADMYEHLREQSGDNAHMVQMGYPQLFDPDYLGLVEPKDVEFLNQMADELNARMARVARENGVHFIDPTEAFQGHGVGSDDPWVLGLGVWSDHHALPPESFHPNAQGQAAMQELIHEYLDSLP